MVSSKMSFLLVLSIVLGVDGLRLVELSDPSQNIEVRLSDRQTAKETLLTPIDKTGVAGKGDPEVHEWLFECANDCGQLLDRARHLPKECTFEESERVGFAVLKGPSTCASDVQLFFERAGALERTGRVSNLDKMLSGKTPTAPTTPSPTTSPTPSTTTPSPTTSPTPSTTTTSPTTSPTDVDTYAVGDPHIQSVVGRQFDLWQTGWSKFLQIPMQDGVVAPQLLVRGKVEAFWGDRCAPAYLTQVSVSGARLGNRSILVHSGSLESSTPFAVQVDDGPLAQIAPEGTTFLSHAGVQVRGVISAPEPELWGPDAQVFVNVGDVTIDIRQHTEGRFEKGQSMLDLSVQGLDGEVEPVGGWLGTDDMSLSAGSPPDGCAEGKLLFSEKPTPSRRPAERHGVNDHAFYSRLSFRGHSPL
jgi:hypothetical protein